MCFHLVTVSTCIVFQLLNLVIGIGTIHKIGEVLYLIDRRAYHSPDLESQNVLLAVFQPWDMMVSVNWIYDVHFVLLVIFKEEILMAPPRRSAESSVDWPSPKDIPSENPMEAQTYGSASKA